MRNGDEKEGKEFIFLKNKIYCFIWFIFRRGKFFEYESENFIVHNRKD